MRQYAGLGLVIVGGALAVVMVMRGIGRFLVFLVVDQPEIGGGFLLSTFATTALGLYIAWLLGSKGLQLSRKTGFQKQQSETSDSDDEHDNSNEGSTN